MKRSLTIAVLTMLGVTLAAAPSGVQGQQVTLKWKYQEGAELIYRQTMTSETEIPGQGMATTENIFTQRWNVLEVADNGDATVQVTTDRVQMSMDGPMGAMSADSASDEKASAPQMKPFMAMAGMSYTLVLGPNGELRSMAGLEELRQRVREALAAEGMGAMLDQALGRSLSEDTMKSMYQQGIQSFPEGQVGPGDTWDLSFDLAVGLIVSMTTHLKFTLESIEDRSGATIAVISSFGSIEIAPTEDGPMAGMMQIGNAATIGTMEFDVDRGLLLKSTGSTTMEMTLKLGDQEQVMSTISNVTMELVEDGP